MAFSKTVEGMDFESTGTKKASKGVGQRAYRNAIESHNSFYTLWVLAVKHRVGLLSIGWLIVLANYIFPDWFVLLTDLVR